MKQTKLLLLCLFCSALFSFAKAQSKIPVTYYVGNWTFAVKDLPDGDMAGVLTLETENDGLKGYFVGNQSTDTVHIDKITTTDNNITLDFSAMGQNVNLTLTPKGEAHLDGMVMGMFAFAADKKKE